MVVNKAREYVEKEITAGNLQGNRDDHVPIQEPDWKPDQDMTSIRAYREYILRGLRDAVKKPQNLSKVYEIRQETNETPSAFLERIYNTFRQYTCEDPEDASNARMVNMIFIGQSAPDIRKKLQKADGATGMPISQLVDIAYQVFTNRESVQEKKQDKKEERKMKMQAALVAAAITRKPRDEGSWRQPQRRGPLEKDQCAFCKRKGHWKREWPYRKVGEGEKKKEESSGLFAFGRDSD
ncbi:uncharacterized protein LOC132248512 [Alligator mississippiensis]|uniref:uncharacterized protein LOC132248512 n=1 Tax=Alligator mississippiensis TaxID=8496 RepID=UPI0028772592|nr:uncharacterized protein LOC132248512 [Alligator mississippiensis]